MCVARMMAPSRACFELYGYDVLVDEEMQPWLLEVNASPSLGAETQEDYDTKYQLLQDTMDVIDLEGKRYVLAPRIKSLSANGTS